MTILASFLDLWLWQLVYAFVGFLVSWFVYSATLYEKRLKKIISLQQVILQEIRVEANTLHNINKHRKYLFTSELLKMRTQVQHVKTTFHTDIHLLEIAPLFEMYENTLDTYTRVWQKL